MATLPWSPKFVGGACTVEEDSREPINKNNLFLSFSLSSFSPIFLHHFPSPSSFTIFLHHLLSPSPPLSTIPCLLYPASLPSLSFFVRPCILVKPHILCLQFKTSLIWGATWGTSLLLSLWEKVSTAVHSVPCFTPNSPSSFTHHLVRKEPCC